MSKKITRFVVLPLAAIMALSIPLYGCSPSEGEEDSKVTFNYNDGGSRPYYSYAEVGETIKEPDTPLRVGYDFVGWTTSQTGTEAVTFPYKVESSDTTLYAMWEAKTYTLTFNMNDGKDTVKTVTYHYDDVITADPSNIDWGDNYLYYWMYSSETSSDRVRFPYTVEGDATFYARWGTEAPVNITLDYNYDGAGDTVALETVAPGDKIKLTDYNPTRVGYNFLGWATTKTATVNDIKSSKYNPTQSATIYGVWERKNCKITFLSNYPGLDSDDPNYSTSKTVLGADEITPPDTNPTRDGYTFTGWYTAKRGGTLVSFPEIADGSTKYYAHWEIDAETTNIFQAEYVEIDPTKQFYGASGNNVGVGIIGSESAFKSSNGYYVTYQYEYGDKLEFYITSDSDVSNAVLYANLALELQPTMTFSPTGDYAYTVTVNGEELSYKSFTLTATADSSGNYKGTFTLINLGNISLKKGENKIVLMTANKNGEGMGGGTLKAAAPMIDYIRIDTTATLSWHPIKDNVETWS
jgi:uncharacterized repeat protein (TIGR02543 family)